MGGEDKTPQVPSTDAPPPKRGEIPKFDAIINLIKMLHLFDDNGRRRPPAAYTGIYTEPLRDAY